jgi:hypothetical protein
MNKDQLARLARHNKVKQVLTDNPTAVASVPAFAKLAARYLGQVALLGGTAQRNAVTSEGATLAKSTVGTALIARLVKMANALYLLYKAATPPNLEEAAKLHRRPSDYVNLTELELAAEAISLNQRATANKALLTSDYNFPAADLKALADDATAFSNQLATPQLAIDDAKVRGATATATLSALNIFLKDDLRAGMELLKDSQPEVYKALREASQVDDAAYRQRKEKKGRKAMDTTTPTGGKSSAGG